MTRERRFGIELGAAALALALLLFWRGRYPDGRIVLLTGGGVMIFIALVRPAWLRPAARTWLAVGDRLAAVTTPLFVTLIYLLIVTPVAVARRRFSRGPLRRDPAAASYWVRRAESTTASRRSDMENQF